MKAIYRTKNGTVITPYQQNQCKAIQNATSTYDAVYHRRDELTGFIIDNYNEQSAFITHNQYLDYLEAHFPDYQIIDRKTTKWRKQGQPFALLDEIQLREVQGNAANEVLRSTKREFFINMQTAMGKTLLSVYLSSKIGVKTWIMCFSTEILRQWIRTYQEKTTKDMDRILFIETSQTLESILQNPSMYTEQYDIFLSTSGLVTSFMKRTDYANLSTIMNILGIGLLIFDEAHRNMSNIVKINAVTNIYKTLYLSADYSQGDEKKEKLFYNIFRNTKIIRPSEEEMYTMKYTKVIVLEYNSHPTIPEKMSINNRYGYSAERYMNYQLKKGVIYKVIDFAMNSIIQSNPNHYRVLILLTQIEHVDKLAMYLKDQNIEGYSIGRYHSRVSEEEKQFALESADIIVTTYKSFSTGIDVSNIKYVIGLNQSNKVEDNQAAGRSRPLSDGSDAVYFMIVDTGFEYCRKKLKSRLKYLKGTKIKDAFVMNFDAV